jgi:hypothetical protein
MKRSVGSVGLVVVCACSLRAASLSDLAAPESSKPPWSVGLTVRGFYDDNVNTTPNDHVSTTGFEVSPALTFGFAWPATSVDLNYTYSYKYYDHRPSDRAEHYDQTHDIDLAFRHEFNNENNLMIRDQFVIGQEPDFLRAQTAFNTYQRVPGDNIRNAALIDFRSQITRVFGLEIGYNNSVVDYQQKGFNTIPTPGGGLAVDPSLSGTLDSLNHDVHLDTRWTISPETVGIVGGAFSQTIFTGGELITGEVDAFGNVVVPLYYSDVRDSRRYRGYLGVEHQFLRELSGHLSIGAIYTDHYNDPTATVNDWTPYVDGGLEWAYGLNSSVGLTVGHNINSTDVVQPNAVGQVTQDQESTVVTLSVAQQIIPRLIGTLQGQYQYSTFRGGFSDSQSESYYLLGIKFEYTFIQHLSAHVGYNYDKLDSQIGRSFDRNRVYIGLTASY